MKKAILFLIGVTGFLYPMAQSGNWDNDPAPLHRAEKALTDVIVHDIFSPPVASRIYVYANIAAYEILIKDHSDQFRSLYGQVKTFPQIPSTNKKISYSLASVYAFLLIGKKLVFSEAILNDSLRNILQWYHGKAMDKVMYDASLQYGQQAADVMSRWIDKDQYKETRKLPRYRLIKKEGKWIPTPPGYMAAIEPYWNKIRPITMTSGDQFQPDPAITFSKDSNSVFYKQAHEVYEAGNKLSDDQKAVASFWDCNPFVLNTAGHLNFASKKISPGGHWMSIVAVATKQKKLDIVATSAAYTITAIGLFDAFISCWDEKYRSNVIRPETYINSYIDESWRPLLQTPPFPEYSSGHSVISTTAAIILTDFLGDHFSYDDDTEVEYGLQTRHFDSFLQAANEAAISRFYGGIHYHAAIENGQAQGRKIGEWVLKTITLKK